MAYSKEQIEETFKRICLGISEGHSLRSVLRRDNTPDQSTFYNWIDNDTNKSLQYAHACDERAGVMFEDMLDIADDTGGDEIELSDGKKVTNHHKINRDKLRVDTRKWALSKMMPRKYSEKHQVDVTSGGDKLDMPMIAFKQTKKEE